MFALNDGINPPLLMLITGATMQGKSTIATFLEQYILSDSVDDCDEEEDVEENKAPGIRLISTDQVLTAMSQHILEEDNPVLFEPTFSVDQYYENKDIECE